MVAGIDKFQEHFADYKDHYAIIGGAACDLLFTEAGLPFRATKDIDMVLCVEVVDAAFGQALKAFLDAGGYQARERSDGKKEYYRFHKPTNEAYPFMLELFSRKPGTLEFPEDVQVTRIEAEDNIVSLSAILLEDGYYEALQAAKQQINGVTVIDQTILIPFKIRAYLDLTDREETGEKVDSKNIKKHRNDVFRLTQLLSTDTSVELSDAIRNDLRRFLEMDAADGGVDLKALGVALTRDQAVALLRSAYMLD
ncbi:hypothetical protein V1291_000820 [Nitrobacteraceae bacterium AZCC 1564]